MKHKKERVECDFGAEILGPEEHTKCLYEQCEQADQEIEACRALLEEGKGHTREEVSEAFVRRGIRFMKGPFRMANFYREDRQRLPTNDELAKTARRIGAEQEKKKA
jgi:hypothetical protein